MNEQLEQAQETLQELSSLALKYLINNFHFVSEEYVERKSQIGNLTEKIRISLDNFYGYKDSQQDLIKGKDEYIAKLCCDRAELKAELKDLQEFAKLVIGKNVCLLDININENANDYNKVNKYHLTICQISQVEFDLLKKVVEKYGK